MLKMTNDKIAWKKWFAATGKAAAKAAGAIGWNPAEYSDTTTYQAAIKTTGNTPKVSDMFSWWSGWLMKELVDAGMLADVSSIWEKQGDAYSSGRRATRSRSTASSTACRSTSPTGSRSTTSTRSRSTRSTCRRRGTSSPARARSSRRRRSPRWAATIDGRWPGFVYFQELMVRKDPALYTALMEGKAKYTDAGVVDVMNMWGDMIKKGYFSDPSAITIGSGANNFPPSFKQGKIAMVTWGTWFEPTLEAAGIKGGDDYGAFMTPNIDDSAGDNLIFETAPWCVAAKRQAQGRRDQGDRVVRLQGRPGVVDQGPPGFTSPRSDVPSANPVDKEIDETIQSGDYKLLNRYWEATPHDIVEVAVDQFVQVHAQARRPDAEPGGDPEAGGPELGRTWAPEPRRCRLPSSKRAARRSAGERAAVRVAAPPAARRRRLTGYLYLLPMIALVERLPAVSGGEDDLGRRSRTRPARAPGRSSGWTTSAAWSSDPAFRTSVRNTVYWVIGALDAAGRARPGCSRSCSAT